VALQVTNSSQNRELQSVRYVYSLKAAIVSSIESNCCATSVVEGIVKQWEVVEVVPLNLPLSALHLDLKGCKSGIGGNWTAVRKLCAKLDICDLSKWKRNSDCSRKVAFCSCP
jgi:hypothetical protein